MITLNDANKWLDLNPRAIYLIMNPDEMDQYVERLRSINHYTNLTRNFFHIDIIEKRNNPYDKLPEDLTRAISKCNVLIRLVDSIHGIFCYGLDYIDLSKGVHELLEQLDKFIDAVCEENIRRLEILSERSTSTSLNAMKAYRRNNIVKEVFETALRREDVPIVARERLQDQSPTLDIADSRDLMRGVIDNGQSSMIEKHRCEFEPPSVRPKISITVKYVRTGKFYSKGKEKIKLGIEININGSIVLFPFGPIDQSILYIATILARSEGHTICRSDFTPPKVNSSPGVMKRHQRLKEILYNSFRVIDTYRDFDEWFSGICKNIHKVDTAVSAIKTNLWKVLSPQYKDAYYYTIIFNNCGNYIIRTDASHITFDDKIISRLK